MWHFVFGSLFLLLISGMTKWKVTLKEKLQGQQQFIVPLTKHDVKSLHQGKKPATKHLNTKITTCNNHLTVRNSQIYLQYKYEIIFCDLHYFSWETIQANNSADLTLNIFPWTFIDYCVIFLAIFGARNIENHTTIHQSNNSLPLNSIFTLT